MLSLSERSEYPFFSLTVSGLLRFVLFLSLLEPTRKRKRKEKELSIDLYNHESVW
jgi:hypothetical protein